MLLHHRFIRTAKSDGKRLFIVDRTVGMRVTYHRALIGALILARRFRRYEPGLLGIMIPPSIGCVVSVLGALLSGHTPVMVNYATGAAKNARYAQEKCGFHAIVTSRALLKKLEVEPVAGMVMIEDIKESLSPLDKLTAALVAALPSGAIERLAGGGDEEDNLLVLFTSGSERDPKAVPLTHRNILANVEALAEIFELSPEDSVLANLPLFHVLGQTATLWVTVYKGLTMTTVASPLDYRGVVAAIRAERPTIMVGTPSFFRGYLRASEPGDFSSVRVPIAGADKVPDVLRTGFREKHGIELLEGYGATETSPCITANTPEHNRPGSVGRPLPGVEIRIENLESCEDCDTLETGKVLVRGDTVMKGYWNDIESTAACMRAGWYDTGDMGYFDSDGYLWLAGRLKRFVKIGGEMVSLVSVETAINDLVPDDVEVCVVGVPDPVKGSRIIAAVSAEVDWKQIHHELAGRLPSISVPREHVVLEDFPMTGGGKSDFRAVTRIVSGMVADTDGQEEEGR
jgi:acyl-[acyl-carrier-protein]-phospholipid O-acyltransferase/long-chain-fatty-acid--[acyl-carrier-protein] ligase